MSYDPANFEKEEKNIKFSKETSLDEGSAEKAYNFMANNLDTLAEYEEAADLLDNYTKHLVDNLASMTEGSEAAKKRTAHADTAYRVHIENLAFAKARFSKMRRLYDLAKIRIEMWRTKEASSRI